VSLNMKWINAGDIKTWSTNKQRDCASLLPKLLRRLILATGDSIKEIDFPSGDSIASGGWDGLLKTDIKSPYFPSGTSGWELGVKTSPGKKAEDDYTKRTDDSLGLLLNETTFVFVTPRSWPDRQKWATKKRATKKWKDVRVIGADGLEQWLEVTPAVSLWLANHLGKASGNLQDIENFWEEWSAGTKPNMTPELVIGGRKKQVEKIHTWLASQPSILSVQGDSPDEPFAFLYSAFTRLPETEKVRAFSRCVVVDTSDQMRQLIQTFKNPLIIVAPVECSDLAGLALKKKHHVFFGAGANVVNIGSITRLDRPRLDVIKKGLLAQGFSEVKANRISRDSGRSIPVLKRRISVSPSVATPPWGNPQSTQVLLPILFIGAWQERKEGDRQVVETLSGKTYQTYLSELQSLLVIDNSPVRKIGDVWMLKSPLDAWFVLAPYLNDTLLSRYQQTLSDVLLKADPKYELPPDKRWAAAVYGKSSSYSDWLRDGLTESLALMSVHGNRASNISSVEAFAGQIVKDLLNSATTWEIWASLNDIAPRLAEAAPDTFLEELGKKLKNNPDLFKSLMRDDGDAVFGECNHSGLLWALESTAWSSTYFARSVNLLASMAEIDPGGRYSNRPINTLTDIFLPKWPQTYASVEQRVTVLDKLISQNPKMVWKFTQSYHSGLSFTEAYRFRWRDYDSTRTGFDPEENPNEYIQQLLPRLKKIACMRNNIIDAFDEFTRLPHDIQKSLITELRKMNKADFAQEEHDAILHHIREAMNWINSYGKGSIREHISPLDRLLNKFNPNDVLGRVGWLLDNPWPRLPQGDIKDHAHREKSITSERNKAAREVLDKVAMKKILKYASKIQYVGVLGRALGTVIRDDAEDAKVFIALIGQAKDNPLLVSSYSQARIEIEGKKWIRKQIKRLKSKNSYTPELCALLYLGLPEEKATWLAVESEGAKVDLAYWKQARGYSRSNKNEDVQFAVEKLLMAKRPKTALEMAGDHRVSLPSKLLKQVILNFLSERLKNKQLVADSMTDYYLANIFRQLYERKELSDEEIAKLEWPFAALFRNIHHYTKKPFAIHRVIEKDPAFFVDLVGMIYKRDDKKPSPKHRGLNSAQSERLARNAKNILDIWHSIPGTKEDGSIDEEVLESWVKNAREKCAESKLITGGDLQLAFMLAHSPADSDGLWPHTAVRNVIDNLDNEVINRHIPIEIYNSRGVVSRSPNEGGKQERTLAQNYKKMSKKLNAKWPVTASVLRATSESYERDARREDIDSDLHDIRWS